MLHLKNKSILILWTLACFAQGVEKSNLCLGNNGSRTECNQCNNTDNIYIPPLCNDPIDEVPEPILEVGYVKAVARINKIPKNWKNMNLSYRCNVKEENGIDGLDTWTEAQTIPVDTGILKTSIVGLKAGYGYSVYCQLSDNKSGRKDGPTMKLVTKCSKAEFGLIPWTKSPRLGYAKETMPEWICPFEDVYDYDLELITPLKDGWLTQQQMHPIVQNQVIANIPTMLLDLNSDETYRLIVRQDGLVKFRKQFAIVDQEKCKIRNPIVTRMTATTVELRWEILENLKQIVTEYKIVLEHVSKTNCKGAKHFTEDFTTRLPVHTFHKLQPYTSYKVRVRACDVECGPEVVVDFDTIATDFPSTSFVDLKYDEISNKLVWKAPNCSLMTGPIKSAMITIQEIHPQLKAKRMFQLLKLNYTFDLHNLTLYAGHTYRVRIYPKRNQFVEHSGNVFTELNFTISPKVPFTVKDLDVWEIDDKENIAQLKWRPPTKQTGEEIEKYTVEVKRTNDNSTKPNSRDFPPTLCSYWPGFICVSIKLFDSEDQITVKAKHKSSMQMSEGVTITVNREDFKRRGPTSPKNVKLETLDSGTTQLVWSLPDRTFSPIKEFIIEGFMTPTLTSNSSATPINYTVPSRMEGGGYQPHYSFNSTVLPLTTYSITLYTKHDSGLVSSILSLWMKG